MSTLPATDQLEQDRINAVHQFGRDLAALTHDEVGQVRAIPDVTRIEMRSRFDELAARTGRQQRCEDAARWARGSLAGGCDAAMQRITETAGGGQDAEWGADCDRWLRLQPSIELHAVSLALDDLLTDDERRLSRIRST